ncbi:hypothetical protein Har1130_03655 [Haloarcula sp. CBA1130]|nr:hypothetical protein Har1129_10000 [Haloarcula sp. CBA1129]KAA9401882.1 hypothetical protein Har1130_03655 [Haloarcula sp. CBA1130]
MQDHRRQTVKEKISYIEQTQGIALAHAKIEIIECMNNGNSQSQCEDQARQEVDSVFSTVQKSLYTSQNRQMQHWQMMDQKFTQTDNLKFETIYPYSLDGGEDDYQTKFELRTVTLYNGEQMEVLTGSMTYHAPDGYETIAPYHYTGNLEAPVDESIYDSDNFLNVVAPDGSTAIPLDGGSFKTALTTLEDKHSSANSAVGSMADSIYSNYEPGEVSVSDAAGPLEVMLTSSGNNDSLTYRLLSAQSAGYAVNDAGKTVDVKADFNGDGSMTTKSGVIYANDDAFPNNEVKTGTTYVQSDDGDSSTVQVSDSVTFVSNPEDSEPEDYPLDGEFTVVQVYDDEGNEVDSMTLTGNDFATTDTSNLNSQISELINKMEALEDKYEANQSSGGGSGISQDAIKSFLQNLGIGVAGGLMIVAVIVVMILFAYIKILRI